MYRSVVLDALVSDEELDLLDLASRVLTRRVQVRRRSWGNTGTNTTAQRDLTSCCGASSPGLRNWTLSFWLSSASHSSSKPSA
jgi:hypothetical protein